MMRILFGLLMAIILPSLCICGHCSTEIKDPCALPNGKGLQNLIKQGEKLLPKDQLLSITQKYADDKEIKALQQLINSDEYQKKLQAVKATAEYRAFQEYACKNLHIDLNYYRRLVGIFIRSIHKVQSRSMAQGSSGIGGLVYDIYKILPQKELKDLYDRLMASDRDLKEAIEKLKSPELYKLIKNLKSVPVYKEYRQMLIDVGVPLDAWTDLIGMALQWPEELDLVF